MVICIYLKSNISYFIHLSFFILLILMTHELMPLFLMDVRFGGKYFLRNLGFYYENYF